jgi:hypothetical protein
MLVITIYTSGASLVQKTNFRSRFEGSHVGPQEEHGTIGINHLLAQSVPVIALQNLKCRE